MTATPRSAADAPRGVLPEEIRSEAWRPGAAEPVAIHVRPELQDRMRGDDRTDPGVPVVVDDGIPAFPGYEIHRAVPGGAGPAGP